MLTILQGDAIEQLRTLPDNSVHCCVTSPPYWGLRDYSTNGQLGLEKTPEQYVAKMVEVFREVRRVLRKDGTCWINLGDSIQNKQLQGIPWRVAFALQADGWWLRSDIIWAKPNPMPESVTDRPTKAHEYLFLLTKSANYFYDRMAICEKAQYAEEHASKATSWGPNGKMAEHGIGKSNREDYLYTGDNHTSLPGGNRNKRSVWTVATAPYPEAHFATYPPDLIKPCIMAGTSAKGCCAKCGSPWERVQEVTNPLTGKSEVRSQSNEGKASLIGDNMFDHGKRGSFNSGGIVLDKKTIGWQPTCKCLAAEWGTHPFNAPTPCTILDPFAGSGTTGAVAIELGRKSVLIELNPKYVELIKTRCNITPGLQLA